YNVRTKQTPQEENSTQPTPSRSTQPRPHKPLSKKTKIIISTVSALFVVFIIFYAWGTHHYSKNNQIDKITETLRNPKEDMSKYVVADTPAMKVTAETVKPLQNYYQEHQTSVTKMNQNLKDGIDPNSDISLVKNGHYLLFFPKYQLQVKTYQPQVETNHGDSSVTINGKSIGKLSGDNGKYYKKLSLIFPGKYHFAVNSKVEGRSLSATSTSNIWANKTLNMDIETQTFSVKSVPNGEVYINDKKVGTLDNDGEITFKSYPITPNMALYVLYNGTKSELVTDMSDSFGDFTSEGDENDDYTDDASNETSADVTKQDGSYVVTPKWKGLISKDDANDLLSDAYEDPNDDKFVNGSDNKWYGQIKQQNDRWDKSDEINSYDTDVSIESIYPAKGNQSKVNYKVTYTLNYDDYTKKQIVEYTGGILQKDGDDYLIKTIGDGKLISSHNEDSDD
ncbi:TcaA 3rd/4th domain-containing protein, partial [Lactobacillus intestinalis]